MDNVVGMSLTINLFNKDMKDMTDVQIQRYMERVENYLSSEIEIEFPELSIIDGKCRFIKVDNESKRMFV